MAWPVENKVDLSRYAALILLVLGTAFSNAHCSRAATYFIDSLQGNDTASGLTTSAAWKSLEKINRTSFRPGDSIALRRGRVWHGSLVFTSSGCLEAPIIIESYGPETEAAPMISGLYAGHLEWTHVRENIYRAHNPRVSQSPGLLIYRGSPVPPVTTLNFSEISSHPLPGAVLLQLDGIYRTMWVTSTSGTHISGYSLANFDKNIKVHVRQADKTGREIQWRQTLPPPEIVYDINALTRPGQWYVAPEQKTIYIFSKTVPTEAAVQPGYEKWGIRLVNCSHITVRDIAVSGFGEVGVWLHNADSVTLDNLRVSNTGCAGHRTGLLLFNSSNCTVSRCTVTSSLGNGIVLYAYPGGTGNRGSCSNLINHNRVTHSGAAGISLSTDAPRTGSLVRDNIIEKNIIEQSNSIAYDAAGIYLLNSGTGNIIRNNTVRRGGNGQLRSSGIMLDGGVSPTLVEHNSIEANSLSGIAASGSGHKILHNNLKNNGNTAWESAQIVLFPVNSNASGCTIQYNAMEAGAGRKLVLRTIMPGSPWLPHNIDCNSYRTADTRPFCWSSSWSCGRWIDFSAWKKLTGQDRHSTLRFMKHQRDLN